MSVDAKGDVQLPGSKLPFSLENPFDIFFSSAALELNNTVFDRLQFTPNEITTLSLIFGLMAALFVCIHSFGLAAVAYIFAYILDCADGMFARTHDMATEFGDYYDHISDIVKNIAILVAILFLPINAFVKMAVMGIFVIITILVCVHMGCQENYMNENATTFNPNQSLQTLQNLCPDFANIHMTKWFGCGTLVVVMALIIGIGIPLAMTK